MNKLESMRVVLLQLRRGSHEFLPSMTDIRNGVSERCWSTVGQRESVMPKYL
jgi:hypothetical protein